MAESDEEFTDRRRGTDRDKFRRERENYERSGRDDRRGGRGDWGDRREDNNWGNRNRDRRDNYRDDYRGGNNRRDRYSPPARHDMSPPMKRMRRDWDNDQAGGGGGNHNNRYGGDNNWGGPMRGGMHHGGGGGGGGGWGASGGDMPPPNQGGFGGHGNRSQDADFPCQPALMTFKQFLVQEDDNISDDVAIKKFNEYKLDFKKQQISEFFLQHKEEEWFKYKYHPDECGKRKEESRAALQKRCDVFVKLTELGKVRETSIDFEKNRDIVKLLDAAVIMMEGGSEQDLEILDAPEEPERDEGRRESRDRRESERSERSQGRPERSVSVENRELRKKRKREDSEITDEPQQEPKPDPDVTATEPVSPGPMPDDPEPPSETAEPAAEEAKDENKEKKKRHRDKSDSYSFSGSESSSDLESRSADSESESEGEREEEAPKQGNDEGEAGEEAMDSIPGQADGADDSEDEEDGDADGDGECDDDKPEADTKEASKQEEGEKEEDTKGGDGEVEGDEEAEGEVDGEGEADADGEREGEAEPEAESDMGTDKAPSEHAEEEPVKNEDGEAPEEDPRPRPMHKTASIFLRNLAPAITKQEVEAMCKRYPGFMRVALQDPQPERRFYRRGWVTFDNTVNIKEICWNLNNIRLRDCEMGAIVNRELKQRVRPINGIVAHKQVAKADIKHCAKIIQAFDEKWKLWEDKDGEKKDREKQPSFGLKSKNPVLKNITDYLVDEGSYEEEALLGESMDDKPKDSNEFTIERDEELLTVLDRMIFYLRIVHSLDYYSATEYPNEDEMPHRCGIMHARGPSPPNRLTQNEVNDWVNNFETKITTFVNMRNNFDEIEAIKLGKKDPENEIEKFVVSNTQELAKDKWLCPISGKKFKGPEFVRKHIFNKQADKVEEVKKEVAYFNNYLMDPKRPQLPDHPSNNQRGAGPPSRNEGANFSGGNFGGGGGNYGNNHHQQGNMMGGQGGYNQGRPAMGGGGYQGNRRGGRGNWGGQNHYSGGGGGGHDNRGGRDSFRNDNRRENNFQRRDRSRPDPRGIIEYRDLDAPDDMEIF